MIEIKVIVSPETNKRLSRAQARTAIARKDLAVGAVLAALLSSQTAVEISQVMLDGLPAMMGLIDAEIELAQAAKRMKPRETAKALRAKKKGGNPKGTAKRRKRKPASRKAT